MTNKQVEVLCDLYKVVPHSSLHSKSVEVSLDMQLEHGILFMTSEYTPIINVSNTVFNIANKMYGIDPKEMNATFYKSFETVAKKSRYELLLDQIVHYCGTYGRESIGKNPITVIPCQIFEVPEVDLSKLKITIIRAISDEEITKLIDETLKTCERPSARIVEAVEALFPLSSIDSNEIRSFELAVIAFHNTNTIPKDPQTFLRYLVYETTGETLLIKNKRLIDAIKRSSSKNQPLACNLLSKADKSELASIFLRYKPLFLAFKEHDSCAPIINKLRRLADKYHKPLIDENVQNYINLIIANYRPEAVDKLNEHMSVRDMIKVLNAMSYRFYYKDGDSVVYNVRNGHSFCIEETHRKLSKQKELTLDHHFKKLYRLLAEKIEKSVRSKCFYIPEYIIYPIPYSEKQFINNIPWGSKISFDTVTSGITVGISWFNKDGARVDLDLHCFDENTHYGWNSGYNSNGIIYSGDMTNAPYPYGAAEAFWLPDHNKSVIFTVNDFTSSKEVPFKLYFTQSKIPNGAFKNRHYIMDPNELFFAPIHIQFRGEERAMTLGYMYKGEFYFFSGNLSNNAVPKGNYAKYLEAIMKKQKHMLDFDALLVYAGARVFRTQDEYDTMVKKGIDFIDLSPNKLTATTFFDIVEGKI